MLSGSRGRGTQVPPEVYGRDKYHMRTLRARRPAGGDQVPVHRPSSSGHRAAAAGQLGRPDRRAHIWRWSGDQISHFQLVTDTLQLAQLLGLSHDR
jgi:hypothetical protein